ncbi:hypothetical protein NDU88_006398 [Pleurodeles waltl]|uniref:Uncharacterized protein n=1 Tax=Pleurodeles waltl TaxID=8319 RepID=A0AAV7L3Q2_PLEWA|nr:hypothetical protein NDU88_006398 [Pleurodeles waltl]
MSAHTRGSVLGAAPSEWACFCEGPLERSCFLGVFSPCLRGTFDEHPRRLSSIRQLSASERLEAGPSGTGYSASRTSEHFRFLRRSAEPLDYRHLWITATSGLPPPLDYRHQSSNNPCSTADAP